MSNQSLQPEEFAKAISASDFSSHWIKHVWPRVKSSLGIDLATELLQKTTAERDNIYGWGKAISSKLGLSRADSDRELCVLFLEAGLSCSDAQICLAQMFLNRERGIPRGGTTSKVKTPSSPAGDFDMPPVNQGTNLIFFWFYASLALECVYRSWSRMGSLLELAIWNNAWRGNPDKAPYPWIVWRRFQQETLVQFPQLSSEKSYQELKLIFESFASNDDKSLRNRRNVYSHDRCSLLGATCYDHEFTGFTSQGQPLIKISKKEPEYEAIFQEVLAFYTKCYEALVLMRQLIDAYAKAKTP